MEGIKNNRLAEERLERLTSRRMTFARYIAACQTTYTLTVPMTELSQIEPFRAIIEDTPPQQAVVVSSFPPPSEAFWVFTQWQNRKKHDLVDIMKKSPIVSWNVNVAHLDLATTFFRCQGPASWEPVGQWETILAHPGTFSWRRSRVYPSVDLARMFEDFQQEFWNVSDRVSFHEPAYLAARSIVAACGFDPDITSAMVMDKWNPIIECASCSGETFFRSRSMMTWRRGVSKFSDCL